MVYKLNFDAAIFSGMEKSSIGAIKRKKKKKNCIDFSFNHWSLVKKFLLYFMTLYYKVYTTKMCKHRERGVGSIMEGGV